MKCSRGGKLERGTVPPSPGEEQIKEKKMTLESSQVPPKTATSRTVPLTTSSQRQSTEQYFHGRGTVPPSTPEGVEQNMNKSEKLGNPERCHNHCF